MSRYNGMANDLARRFNLIAEAEGFDLPLEVLLPLIGLFEEALASADGASSKPCPQCGADCPVLSRTDPEAAGAHQCAKCRLTF